MKLFNYFESSTSVRVPNALKLKVVINDDMAAHLVKVERTSLDGLMKSSPLNCSGAVI
jgi:hypothetical protein